MKRICKTHETYSRGYHPETPYVCRICGVFTPWPKPKKGPRLFSGIDADKAIAFFDFKKHDPEYLKLKREV